MMYCTHVAYNVGQAFVFYEMLCTLHTLVVLMNVYSGFNPWQPYSVKRQDKHDLK
jgi:hypothetical protein